MKILEKFGEKLPKTQKDLKSELKFMRGICEHSSHMKSKFDTQMFPIMFKKKIAQIVEKVPVDLEINGKYAKTLLQTQVDTINTLRQGKIWILNIEIRNELDFRVTKYDPNFKMAYNLWKFALIDEKHLDKIRGELKNMKADYDELNKIFVDDMNFVDDLTHKCGKKIRSFDKMGSKILDTEDPDELRKIIQDFGVKLAKILEQHTEWIERLENMKSTLIKYNMKRYVWIKFVLSITKKLESSSSIKLISMQSTRMSERNARMFGGESSTSNENLKAQGEEPVKCGLLKSAGNLVRDVAGQCCGSPKRKSNKDKTK